MSKYVHPLAVGEPDGGVPPFNMNGFSVNGWAGAVMHRPFLSNKAWQNLRFRIGFSKFATLLRTL